MELIKIYSLLFYIILFAFKSQSTPASAHLHSHNRNLNDERVEDGHFKPRHSNDVDADEHDFEFDHQSILGSVKEADEFDSLPPAEAKRRLAILITRMDLNNDQYIDRNELKAWIIRSFKSLAEEDAQERFEDIDENNDGRITWQEYLSDFTGSESEEDLTDQLIQDDKELFEASDLNKDGYLILEEFSIFNRAEEHPITKPIILKHTLRDKDTNKDGFVDFQEYLGTRGYEQDKEWVLTEKEKFETEYDKDKDGKLNNAELLSWFIPNTEEMAEDEVDHLFGASDDDHDNLLSFEEIIDHHDIFVGSEATDYGSQLHKVQRDEL